MKMNSHSVWEPAGFLIQATNKPGIFRFANLNPEVEFKNRLTRMERIRIGFWFLLQATMR